MDKKIFIRELERSLSVLQEDELKDIIGEYEQHIDMKVQSGLTEEEAIADFGSLPELSAEILEAYHVRADYAAPGTEKGKRFSLAEGEKAGKEILEQTGELCARTGRWTAKGLKRFGGWLRGVLLYWKVQAVRPFSWIKRKLEACQEERAGRQLQEAGQMQEAGQRQLTKAKGVQTGMTGSGKKQGLFAGAGRAAAAMAGIAAGACRICRKAAGWCVRIAWNLCWVGFAVFCGVMGLFCLFGLGMLVVLLAQGYPMTGVTIGCLGLNLCLFAAAGLGMTMLWRSAKAPVVTKKQIAESPEDRSHAELSADKQGSEGEEHA